MTRSPTPDLAIEPLDLEHHDRAAFSCGVEQVDNFLKKTAGKLTRADNTRVYVLADPAGAIIGFYAINAHAIDYQDLPKRFTRTRPAHGSIPAAFVSMIGVDHRYGGKGYGGDLLADALLRVVGAADQLGIAVAILDVLDDGDAEVVKRRLALYARYGFQPLPSQPLRLFLPVATIRKTLQPEASS